MTELLSLPRAARRVGVTAKWLKTEADAARVPHLRAGSRYLFDLAALSECLRARAGGSPLDEPATPPEQPRGSA